jgi:hypothetical protein
MEFHTKKIKTLGAINKKSGEYVYPKIASKNDEYICPDCKRDLVLCKGEQRIDYFRHYNEKVNPCNLYNNPSESQIHKDGKMLLKKLLETEKLNFIRKCKCCKNKIILEIPEIKGDTIIELEKTFIYYGKKIGDVVQLDNNNISCIYEIYYTHKTEEKNRPEPWFELDAIKLINKANNEKKSSILEIECIREDYCNNCNEERLKSLMKKDLEKYIRITLGQKIFYCDKDNIFYDEKDRKIGIGVKKKKINGYQEKVIMLNYDEDNVKDYIEVIDDNIDENYSMLYEYKKHDKFCYDSKDCYYSNKILIEKFNNILKNYKIIIHSVKGTILSMIVNNNDYKKYDYWNCNPWYTNNLPYDFDDLPFIYKNEDIGDKGTVGIIEDAISIIINLNKEIDNKLKKIDNVLKKAEEKLEINRDDKKKVEKYKDKKVKLIIERNLIMNYVNYEIKKIFLDFRNAIIIRKEEDNDKIIVIEKNNKLYLNDKEYSYLCIDYYRVYEWQKNLAKVYYLECEECKGKEIIWGEENILEKCVKCNKIYIDVKFQDKDEVKKYGGKWDIEKRCWYILKSNEDIETILTIWKESDKK